MCVTVCSDAMANCATCTSATACTTCQTGFYETAGSPDTCTSKWTAMIHHRISKKFRARCLQTQTLCANKA